MIDDTLGVLLKYQDDIAKAAKARRRRGLLDRGRRPSCSAAELARWPSRSGPPRRSRGAKAGSPKHRPLRPRRCAAPGCRSGRAAVRRASRGRGRPGFGDRDDFYCDARTPCFVTRRRAAAVFDEAFRLFWRDPRAARPDAAPALAASRGDEPPAEPRAAERRAAEALCSTARSRRGSGARGRRDRGRRAAHLLGRRASARPTSSR